MRADHHPRLAGCDAIKDGIAFLALGAAGQDVNRDAGRSGHPGKGRMVLPGEDFRRCHQHGLAAGFDRCEHRHQRHHRLAGADVALQQPQHAFGACHVLEDIGNSCGLARRQRKGKGVDDRPGESAGGVNRNTSDLAQTLSDERQ
ncbi:hypothetical protein D9M68_725570 [compost metagenome]